MLGFGRKGKAPTYSIVAPEWNALDDLAKAIPLIIKLFLRYVVEAGVRNSDELKQNELKIKEFLKKNLAAVEKLIDVLWNVIWEILKAVFESHSRPAVPQPKP